MYPLEKPLLFEVVEILADSYLGNPNLIGKLDDTDPAPLIDQLKNNGMSGVHDCPLFYLYPAVLFSDHSRSTPAT